MYKVRSKLFSPYMFFVPGEDKLFHNNTSETAVASVSLSPG